MWREMCEISALIHMISRVVARREVRVALPSMENTRELTTKDTAAISAAATQAAQQQLSETGEKDGGR